LQNTHAFHLCPSETEGYGHYIVEALSVGAVVVSVDAPPMNELVTPEHGILAPFARTGTQRLATTYFFDDEGMEATIERLLALPDVECNALGRRARGWYEQNDRAFRSRIVEALHALA
jgi:glycosyltransferase involved in cell wall biosynthesis